MIKHILVPLDGSDLANDVLPYVEDVAKCLGAQVSFVQVVSTVAEVPATWVGAGALINPEFIADELEEEAKIAESTLSALAKEWQTKGIVAKWEVLRGAPGPSIVSYAREHDVDLVAMCTHGRSGLSRMIFGSVAEQVVRDGGIPVFLVRPQGHAEPHPEPKSSEAAS